MLRKTILFLCTCSGPYFKSGKIMRTVNQMESCFQVRKFMLVFCRMIILIDTVTLWILIASKFQCNVFSSSSHRSKSRHLLVNFTLCNPSFQSMMASDFSSNHLRTSAAYCVTFN